MLKALFPDIEASILPADQGWPSWFRWPSWLPRDTAQSPGVRDKWLKRTKALIGRMDYDDLLAAAIVFNGDLDILGFCLQELDPIPSTILTQLNEGRELLQCCQEQARETYRTKRTGRVMRRLGIRSRDEVGLTEIMAALGVESVTAYITAAAVVAWALEHAPDRRYSGTYDQLDAAADAIPGTAAALARMKVLSAGEQAGTIVFAEEFQEGGSR